MTLGLGNYRGKIVCITEGDTTPWKKLGHQSVVYETTEKGEESTQTLVRALKEELLLDPEVIQSSKLSGTLVGYYRADDGTLIVFSSNVYLVYLRVTEKTRQILTDSRLAVGEVCNRYLCRVDELLGTSPDKLRPGTRLALDMVREIDPTRVENIFVLDGREVSKEVFGKSF